MTEPLLQAYKELLTRAPGAAFQRARNLYLNKYPLPEPGGETPLRLYVCKEGLEETLDPANDGNSSHRIVTLTMQAKQLAIVHWQNREPAAHETIATYLKRQWRLDPEALFLEPQEELWFREGGYQLRFPPPKPLIVQQRSLLTLAEENKEKI